MVRRDGQRREFILDELDEMQIENIRLTLKYELDAVRERILDGMNIWATSRAWDELREINGQLDKITNFLAIRKLVFPIT